MRASCVTASPAFSEAWDTNPLPKQLFSLDSLKSQHHFVLLPIKGKASWSSIDIFLIVKSVHQPAAGRMYDPNTKLVCGLQPMHFVTMATPHMGCDGYGPAQASFETVVLLGQACMIGH